MFDHGFISDPPSGRIGDGSADHGGVRAPVAGSIVYCNLLAVEHSGVYVGKNQIVHLTGSGAIELTTPSEFRARLGGWNNAVSIFVSCRDGKPVGSKGVARAARSLVGTTRDYNLLLDNCHQFAASCLSGEPDNPNNFMTFRKAETRRHLGANEWRVWKRIGGTHLDLASYTPDERMQAIRRMRKEYAARRESLKTQGNSALVLHMIESLMDLDAYLLNELNRLVAARRRAARKRPPE